MKYHINKTGVLLFFAFIGIFALSATFQLYYLFDAIRFPSDFTSDNTPWYFIHQGMATAIAYSIGLILILVLTRIFRKGDPFGADVVAGQALLWMGYPAFFGIIILLNTRHLFDPEAATTVWQTQKAYLNSFAISTFVYLILWGVFSFIRRRRQRKLAFE